MNDTNFEFRMGFSLINHGDPDGLSTSFSDFLSDLSKRVQRILEDYVDLLDWNIDYVEIMAIPLPLLTFIDFSLGAKGWFGRISLESKVLVNPHNINKRVPENIEYITISSAYDLRVKKRYWSRLTVLANTINNEVPSEYCSWFQLDPNTGQTQLITRYASLGHPISDQQILYVLTAHRMVSHQFCPRISQVIESFS